MTIYCRLCGLACEDKQELDWHGYARGREGWCAGWSLAKTEDAAIPRSKKGELLAHYATQPVQLFTQIDGFVGQPKDVDTEGFAKTLTSGDDDGDAINSGETYELMRTPGRDCPVRVLIHEDADPEDVTRVLKKMLGWWMGEDHESSSKWTPPTLDDIPF